MNSVETRVPIASALGNRTSVTWLDALARIGWLGIMAKRATRS